MWHATGHNCLDALGITGVTYAEKLKLRDFVSLESMGCANPIVLDLQAAQSRLAVPQKEDYCLVCPIFCWLLKSRI